MNGFKLNTISKIENSGSRKLYIKTVRISIYNLLNLPGTVNISL